MINRLNSIFTKYSSNPSFPALKIQMYVEDKVHVLQTKHDSRTSRILTGNETWHIGSCGKSLTANMIHQLVERDILSYDDIIFERITLADLLTHGSGIRNEYPDIIWKDLISQPQTDSFKRELVFNYWSNSAKEKSKHYLYSNWNYVIAAVFASHRTGISYESLMEKYVFTPHGLLSAGFGPPGAFSPQEALWGHFDDAGNITPIDPATHADNPLFLAPAGGIHLNSNDWAKFIKIQMNSSANWNQIPALPINHNCHYLATGWVKENTNSVLTYSHTGCNTMWTASATFAPDRNIFWTLQANCGSIRALQLIHEASQEILFCIGLK